MIGYFCGGPEDQTTTRFHKTRFFKKKKKKKLFRRSGPILKPISNLISIFLHYHTVHHLNPPFIYKVLSVIIMLQHHEHGQLRRDDPFFFFDSPEEKIGMLQKHFVD